MYDPLQALLEQQQQQQQSNGQQPGNVPATSPPATPSKSKITSRPPPYVRPTPTSPGSQHHHAHGGGGGGLTTPSSFGGASASHQVEQFANGAGQQYTSIVRSQSPLAPRPPLPGQMQRPVSPIQWNQSNLHHHHHQQPPHHDQLATTSATPQRASSLQGAPSFPFSPTSPNAWASSSSSASASASSPPASASTHASTSTSNANSAGFPRPSYPQSSLSAHIPAPGPVPVPQPISGIAGPSSSSSSSASRPLNSPGIPRSPVAESPNRPILSAVGGNSFISDSYIHSGPSSSSHQQQQANKVPPYIRIRVTGIDRAKKELGIKMDAQTNIPTYHRKQSPIFERTYNEFALLHGALSANHPETILPAMPLPQTSASNEDEEDRFLKGVFQKFMDRITRDKSVLMDDELRGFIEADFGYTPLTKAKKLKSGSGFLSRSTSKPLVGEDGEPDFLVTAKVHSAALESAIAETCKSLDKVLKQQTTCASVYAELATSLSSFSTTETHLPLTEGMKALSEAMMHIAQLETGQSNATALVLGDSLAYEAVEARSAKDALLQRQYNIDELRNSIKTTINKRRNIEKLRAGGSIKPERVNEALDDLEEAAKMEQNLQHRVEAISRNLRPSLQTHLRTMNDDMISIALGQARTMLAYENRKLQIYESVHAKIQKIPERGSQEQNVVYVHPSQQQPSAASALTSDNPTVAPASAAPTSTAIASAVPTASAGMSSSVSAQSHGSASIVHGGGMAQSKFMATQAAIQAEMQAQREREERQRAQYAQARAYQHQKSASVVQQLASSAQSGSALEPQQAAASASGVTSTPPSNVPVSPPRVMQVPPTPQSPLHNSSSGGGGASLPDPSAGGSGGAGPSAPGLTQFMFMPTPGGPVNAPHLRSPPTSPLRHGRSASQQGGPGMPAQQGVHNGSNAVDPLLGSVAAHTGFGGRDQPAASYATLPGHVVTSNGTGTGIGTNGGGNSPAPYSAAGGAHMTQSVFLPGRNAQPGFRPAHANQSADERKRADARKAANLLAGAF